MGGEANSSKKKLSKIKVKKEKCNSYCYPDTVPYYFKLILSIKISIRNHYPLLLLPPHSRLI